MERIHDDRLQAYCDECQYRRPFERKAKEPVMAKTKQHKKKCLIHPDRDAAARCLCSRCYDAWYRAGKPDDVEAWTEQRRANLERADAVGAATPAATPKQAIASFAAKQMARTIEQDRAKPPVPASDQVRVFRPQFEPADQQAFVDAVLSALRDGGALREVPCVCLESGGTLLLLMDDTPEGGGYEAV